MLLSSISSKHGETFCLPNWFRDASLHDELKSQDNLYSTSSTYSSLNSQYLACTQNPPLSDNTNIASSKSSEFFDHSSKDCSENDKEYYFSEFSEKEEESLGLGTTY